VYLWSVHDFMAYAIFAGWSTHGRLTCPYCGSDTYCFCLAQRGKITYFDCHQHGLPRKHPFRSDKKNFIKNTMVTKGPPKCLNATEICTQLNNLVLNEKGDKYQGFGVDHNWTHICGLWELPYMPLLILVHNIDVMNQNVMCNAPSNPWTGGTYSWQFSRIIYCPHRPTRVFCAHFVLTHAHPRKLSGRSPIPNCSKPSMLNLEVLSK
jgi:hypothetical protein